MEATVAWGLTKRPQRRIISSYHHHSRHTDAHVGTASRSRADHPRRQRLRQRLRLVRTMERATPAMPIRRRTTRK
ncbi:unnamed protein product [Spirodela intermedia]|uniref:Uncharacterized protein n=1 Tax=Spirodela intermedia TaxID=51605 RepID=A0A7I8IIC7_SPIIN|nr:unnamed protein product [Spirodela intermedia]CAA6657625.1 unnamed protein product [Spirodela intermedia]